MDVSNLLSADFEQAHSTLSRSFQATVRSANEVASQDLGFQRSISPELGRTLDKQSRSLLKSAEKLINRSRSSAQTKVALADADAIDTNWKAIVDTLDNLYERADSCLDEYSGLIRKPQEPQATRADQPTASTFRARERLPNSIRRPKLPKPQDDFSDRPFNHETQPFKPFLTAKPHSKTSLEDSLVFARNENDTRQYRHPYEDEIRQCQYPSFVREKTKPRKHQPWETTGATFVDTPEELVEMVNELKKAKEIAIDLEHHDQHSYIGLVSLMQISTRDRDWIVDTLKPWRRRLELLNEVFTDPNILKVFHGAHMDIIWLQRDLGLYVVGLFDTFFAAVIRCYSGKSLAYLLRHFVRFEAQKQYQTADWRIRPLPKELMEYARADTHFLLFIYDCMRNELIDQGIREKRDCIGEVMDRSKDECLQRYEHPFYDDSINGRRYGWAPALSRQPGVLSREQIAVFAKLHKWRDSLARQDDESVNTILTTQSLIELMRTMPEDKKGVFSSCNYLSDWVKKHVNDIVKMIQDGKANAAAGPDMNALIAAQFGGPREFWPDSKSAPESTAHDRSVLGVFRLFSSAFWGKNSSLENAPSPSDDKTYRINLQSPWSTSETLEDSAKSKKDTADAKVNGADSAAPASNGVLGKRKDRDEEDEQPSHNGEDEDNEAAVREAERKAKRQERKSRKQKRVEERPSATVENGSVNGDPDQEQSSGARGFSAMALPLGRPFEKVKKATKAVFNPFTAGEKAETGLKRAKMKPAGKSMTFKN